MNNYWVVGASWNGQDDQSEKFFKRGYWYLGWTNEEQPEQASLRNQIKSGDRIAIKRMLGQGSPDIKIIGIGIVKEIDQDDKRVYVNWFVTDLDRNVPSKGCYASIHGPFQETDLWTKEVFCI